MKAGARNGQTARLDSSKASALRKFASAEIPASKRLYCQAVTSQKNASPDLGVRS
jgi:hypothetical protein